MNNQTTYKQGDDNTLQNQQKSKLILYNCLDFRKNFKELNNISNSR